MKALAWFAWLLAALALVGCGSREPAWVKIDPALAELAPHDSVMLLGVRAEAARATPVYQKWVAQQRSADLDRFAKETGFDLRKDVSELLVASTGKDTLVAAKGRFSREALEARLEKSGRQRMAHKRYTLFGTEEGAVVFLNSSTAAAGPAPVLRSMIDNQGRAGIPARLLEKIKTIPAENQIWAVTLGASQLADRIPEGGNLSNLRRVLGSVESSTLGIDLRSGLKLTSVGTCRTEEDAKMIHDGIRGLVGMGRLMTPDNQPELLRFYDAIQVAQQETSVTVRADVPMDVLEKVLAVLERQGRM